MNNKILVASDLHLSDEEYRWAVFPLIKELCEAQQVDHILFTGDLTDAKDNHSSLLVNRLTEAFDELADACAGEIYILHGNHDGRDITRPYFKYLRFLQARVNYIDSPQWSDALNAWLLPHSRDPVEDWKDIDFTDSIVYTHITVNGVKVENKTVLTSEFTSEYFKKAKWVISGDIHVPQVIGNVEYVGCPYNIRYGDDFKGRVLLVDSDPFCVSSVDTSKNFPAKPSVDVRYCESVELSFKNGEIKKGDSVKVVLHIDQSNITTWRDERTKIIQFLKNEGCKCLVKLESDVQNQMQLAAESNRNKVDNRQDPLTQFIALNNISDELAAVGREIHNRSLTSNVTSGSVL